MENDLAEREGAIADISATPVPLTSAPRCSMDIEVEPKSRFTVTSVAPNEIVVSRFTVTKVEEFPRSKSISSSISEYEEFHDVPESVPINETPKLRGRDIFRDVEFSNSPPVSSEVWFNLLDSFSQDSSETIESSDSFESAADVLETYPTETAMLTSETDEIQDSSEMNIEQENKNEIIQEELSKTISGSGVKCIKNPEIMQDPPSKAAELYENHETTQFFPGNEVNLTGGSELFQATNVISTSAEVHAVSDSTTEINKMPQNSSIKINDEIATNPQSLEMVLVDPTVKLIGAISEIPHFLEDKTNETESESRAVEIDTSDLDFKFDNSKLMFVDESFKGEKFNSPSSTKCDEEMRRAKSPPLVPPRPKHLNKRYGMMAYLNLPLSRRMAPVFTGQRLMRARRRNTPRCTSQPELRESGEESVTLHVNLVCESNRTSPCLTGELAGVKGKDVEGHCYFNNIKSSMPTLTNDPSARDTTDEHIKTDCGIQPNLTTQSKKDVEKVTHRNQESNGAPSHSLQSKFLQKASTSSEETFGDEIALTSGPSNRAIIQRSAAYPKTPPASPRPPRRAIGLQRRAQGDHGVTRGGGHSDTVGAVRRRLATALAAASAMRNLTTTSHRNTHTPEPEEQEEAPRVSPNGELTPLGWRWHRLHLSSARLEVASATSELFAGFVMLALVEMQINLPCTVPDVAWALFAANTTALVGLNILALTATTCVLPDVSVIPRLAPCISPTLLRESPHERLRSLVRLVWAAANCLGLALFFVEITLVAWVKFWDLAFIGAEISTWIGIPALLIFVGVASFLWRTLERHETQLVHEDAEHVERAGGSAPPSRHASQLQLDMLSVTSHSSEDESDDERTEEGAWRCLHVALGKLEATNCMSELLAGFGTSATVELQTNSPTLVTPWLFAVLAVNTMLLVVVNLFTLMFATFLLPSMRALSESKAAAMLARGPHIRLRRWVAAAWSVTTLLGVLLFLTEVGVLCWVKFLDFSLAASLVSSLAVLLAAVAYLAALLYFYCQHRQGLKARRKKHENLRSTPSLRY